jgi:hypothetical protein
MMDNATLQAIIGHLNELKTELKNDVKSEISALETNVKDEIGTVTAGQKELKAEMNAVNTRTVGSIRQESLKATWWAALSIRATLGDFPFSGPAVRPHAIAWKRKVKHPCPERDSNPRSQQPTGQDLRLTQRGHRNGPIRLIHH